jgi:hypothetical protein
MIIDRDTPLTLPAGAHMRDFWDAWVFAAVESGIALTAWLSAAPADRELGYCAYVACLDREEQAATVLAQQVQRAGTAPLGVVG